MQDFFSALALVLVIEGVLYAAFPTQMRDMVQRMSEFPDSVLRGSGLFIDSVIYGLDDMPKVPESFRNDLSSLSIKVIIFSNFSLD